MKNNISKVVALVLIIVVAVMFTSCGNYGQLADTPNRFKEVSKNNINGNDCILLVDTETRVMYLEVVNGYRLGLTVMLNSDGTPMLYNGDL